MDARGRWAQQVCADLERIFLKGLQMEWQAASGLLRPSLRQGLRPPLFRIADTDSVWGRWWPEGREISISRRLLFQHTWDAVREVLYHETAHQIADELLGGQGGSPPHGSAFREACRLIGANPKASGGFATLDQRVRESGCDRETDRLLGRIRKLLALAESPHRDEAEAAMAKAHQLVRKYNVELVGERRERGFESVFVGRPSLRHPREEVYLANLLQDFYFVQGVWVPAFVAEKERMGRALEISGTVKNLVLAHYVYDFVKEYIAAEWKAYNAGRGLNRHRRTDFAVGVIAGFRKKLDGAHLRETSASGERGLQPVTDPMLAGYLRERYPCLRTERRGAVRRDTRVLEAGVASGKNMVLRKGVSSRGARGGLLP